MLQKLTAVVLVSASLVMALPAFAAAADSAAPAATVLSKGDRTAIQMVITRQIKALQAEDLDAAFALSAPDVRRQFGTAGAFAEMIREDYEPLLKHYSRTFLEITVEDEEVIQPVRIVSRDGTVVMALFGMERQPDGEWKVYGCRINETELHAA